MTKKQKNNLLRIIIAAVLLIILALLPLKAFFESVFGGSVLGRLLTAVLFLVPYFIVGYDILWRAIKNIRHGQVFDENFLMAVATVGAFALGEYTESVAVMLFYQIGELFQSYAVGKSRRNISELMDIRPDYANLEVISEDGSVSVETVDPDEVEIGSVIVIKPGEKIPIDGTVVEGASRLDTASLTGESRPRSVASGDAVLSGCINLSGVLRVETTTDFDESTASKILDLVENASSRKSRSENFISKFAKYYTPIVCFSALALAVLPPLFRLVISAPPEWSIWIYRALTFLVISCPCALVISIPLSFFAGIGGASRQGILIKGSNFLETLSKVRTVVFDKTGTLTRGNFAVTEVVPAAGSSHTKENLLYFAAHIECFSSHPIAKSLRDAYENVAQSDASGSMQLPDESADTSARATDDNRVSDIEEIGGHGVRGKVDGHSVAAGNAKLMQMDGMITTDANRVSENVETPSAAFAEVTGISGTVVYLAIDGCYAGYIVISDEIKPTAKDAIAALKTAGVRKTVMLTGDATDAANVVASELGITEVHAELLPEDKVSKVEALLAENGRASVSGDNANARTTETIRNALAFVGDGINDAPVLTRADIGIAMGALGSDAAIEAADIVLMDDDPQNISRAIAIAKKCMRIVYENIVFAIGVKVICLILGALGIANMWVAIFADVGVMVICVLNAIRVLFGKS